MISHCDTYFGSDPDEPETRKLVLVGTDDEPAPSTDEQKPRKVANVAPEAESIGCS